MPRFALLIAARVVICASLAEGAPPRRPNIVFIFADDQSYEAVGAAGRVDIETPHLDRLAQRGTTFTHAYNMGSWTPAVCVASRTMLITGRSLWRAQAIHPSTERERAAERLWPQLLEKQGYATYFSGKWHINTNAAQTFGTTAHVRPGMPKDTKEAYQRPVVGQPDPWSPSDPKFGGFWAGGKHWSEVVADDAVAFLASARQAEQPFFMYLAFNAPHDPRQAPQEYVDKYPLDRIAVPRSFQPQYPYAQAMGAPQKLRDENLAPSPRTEFAIKTHRREYFAAITHLDAQIGRILAALDASGKGNNTWIFFTADHGLAVGHHGLLGKQNMYDHSLRVPFIVAGPGVKEGRRIDAPIYLQDVMPTTLTLAGTEPPEQVEFQSLLPLLQGEESPARREAIYGAYLQQQRAIIYDGWKLIVYPTAPAVRLYHLADDPDELHDLAGDEAHAERLRDLFRRLQAEQKRWQDNLALPDSLVAG